MVMYIAMAALVIMMRICEAGWRMKVVMLTNNALNVKLNRV